MDQPHWLIGKLTDRGRMRAHNQDALATGEGLDAGLLVSKGMLCVVADGFGKAGSGAQASDLAVRMVVQECYGRPSADVLHDLLSEPRTCRWSVAVMRRTGTDAEGKPVGVAISPRSPERTFAWTLEASTPTPTVTPTSTPTPSPTFQRPQ